jgi:hypothetical protein
MVEGGSNYYLNGVEVDPTLLWMAKGWIKLFSVNGVEVDPTLLKWLRGGSKPSLNG